VLLSTQQLATLYLFRYHPLLRITAFGGHFEITISLNLFPFEVGTRTKTAAGRKNNFQLVTL